MKTYTIYGSVNYFHGAFGRTEEGNYTKFAMRGLKNDARVIKADIAFNKLPKQVQYFFRTAKEKYCCNTKEFGAVSIHDARVGY